MRWLDTRSTLCLTFLLLSPVEWCLLEGDDTRPLLHLQHLLLVSLAWLRCSRRFILGHDNFCERSSRPRWEFIPLIGSPSHPSYLVALPLMLLNEQFVSLISTGCADIGLTQLIFRDLLSCLLDELAKDANVIKLFLQLITCLIDAFCHLISLVI